MPGTRFTLELQPNLPERLARLEALASNLLYSWDRQVRSLFRRLDPELWDRCGHNPKVFLRQVAQQKLEAASCDNIYLQDYYRVLSSYDAYLAEPPLTGVGHLLDPKQELVAYFCAEFGLHESFPIYSGGLGILAGDHCKAASDMGVPFVGVGLLYRQGYFTQTIDRNGQQIAHYHPHNFDDLPITPALRDGNEVRVGLELPGRQIELKVWQAQAGHITLYLLDSDLPCNSEHDRAITYQLYGGDIHTRIQQEMILGIAGVRALRALGLRPTVWHINEGHAAFQVVERIRERIASGLDFDTALEAVAAATVFTTHTPVPAGHDLFSLTLMREYFSSYIHQLRIDEGRFFALGQTPDQPDSFNQTALALRATRFHNGVSRIHGGVASQMANYIWPQIPPAENPIGYVTNGVHVPTFLAREWVNQLDMQLGGGWRAEQLNNDYWRCIDQIPDHSFWSLRQSLKSQLLAEVRNRVQLRQQRCGCPPSQMDRITRLINPQENDVLTVGFARRFATYKRATLIFSDLDRLARLLNDPARPVVLLFAGKAHPHDKPGQELIRVIHEISRRPEFEGRVILLEDYDLNLGRRLVAGVDIWLNNPEYPLEASGTSGQKAGINGAINLSVTDGWWGEGYDGSNGWAIPPHGESFDPEFSNRAEAHELLDILEHQVIPLYFQRNGHGYSEGWVAKSKASMRTLLPRFNAQRMVMDYCRDYYAAAARQRRRLHADNCQPAAELAQWKQRIATAWPGVRLRRCDHLIGAIRSGQTLPIEVCVHLNGLAPEDLLVECLVGSEQPGTHEFLVQHRYRFGYLSADGDEARYRLDLEPPLAGLQYYKIRCYPHHELLSHPLESGLMLWI